MILFAIAHAAILAVAYAAVMLTLLVTATTCYPLPLGTSGSLNCSRDCPAVGGGLLTVLYVFTGAVAGKISAKTQRSHSRFVDAMQPFHSPTVGTETRPKHAQTQSAINEQAKQPTLTNNDH